MEIKVFKTQVKKVKVIRLKISMSYRYPTKMLLHLARQLLLELLIKAQICLICLFRWTYNLTKRNQPESKAKYQKLTSSLNVKHIIQKTRRTAKLCYSNLKNQSVKIPLKVHILRPKTSMKYSRTPTDNKQNQMSAIMKINKRLYKKKNIKNHALKSFVNMDRNITV